MTMFIKLEHLVGNALISLYEEKGIDKIDSITLTNYENALSKDLVERNIDFVIAISKDLTNDFINNTKYFDVFETDDNIEYVIKENITVDNLRKAFRSSMPYDLLKALVSEPVLKSLGIQKENTNLKVKTLSKINQNVIHK